MRPIELPRRESALGLFFSACTDVVEDLVCGNRTSEALRRLGLPAVVAPILDGQSYTDPAADFPLGSKEDDSD